MTLLLSVDLAYPCALTGHSQGRSHFNFFSFFYFESSGSGEQQFVGCEGQVRFLPTTFFLLFFFVFWCSDLISTINPEESTLCASVASRQEEESLRNSSQIKQFSFLPDAFLIDAFLISLNVFIA